MNLTGKLLIAMPSIQDGVFDHTVVFVCSHDAQGAMGLVINHRADNVALGELLDHLDIEVPAAVASVPVMMGGPVEQQRGFVLHSADYKSDVNSLSVDDNISMSATLDVLEDIAQGQGPKIYRVMLGYAGWGPGQLEGEIAQNGWLTAEADLDLIFYTHPAQVWEKALAQLGVEALVLSSDAGHA